MTDAFRWVGARSSPVGYLSALLAGTVVMSTVFLLVPSGTGQLLVVVAWAVTVSLLWFACATPVRVATGWLGGFLLAYLALWAYQVSLGTVRGEMMPAVTLLVPFILLHYCHQATHAGPGCRGGGCARVDRHRCGAC